MPGRRTMDPGMRRRVMGSIKKRDTVPELTLRSALWSAGVRGWRCHLRVPGTPDVAFPRWRVAVFVDGVWWHGHPDYLPRGRRGPYWDEKIARNMARDREVNETLTELGWRVLRFWDLDVLAAPATIVATITAAMAERGWRGRSSGSGEVGQSDAAVQEGAAGVRRAL